ncbi:MAG: hypothetical protein H6668_21215 [Ardenticatenaceae bacterium]|nr:hypothetical protein [Ardenticatenaceae bacterium]
MAVIIDEFQVVLSDALPQAGPPQLPLPATPKADLKPQDIRDVMQRQMERKLRLFAH